jgi:hypothetical protein
MRNTKIAFAFLAALLIAPSARGIVIRDDAYNDSLFASPVTAVGQVVFGGSGCSGSLLSTGLHFLTAAHCVGSFNGTATVNLHNGTNGFSYTSTRIAVNPTYTNYLSGGDLALITLNQVADSSLQRLSLYTGSGELNQAVTMIGLGRQGKGSAGWMTSSFQSTNGLLDRRQGTNVVDSITGTVLNFDFDDPLSSSRSTTGSSAPTAREAILSFGDSGGPVLLNGFIVGVNSFISCIPGTTNTCATGIDVDGVLNSTYGERWGATRVSAFTAWLSSELGQSAFDSVGVPEPSTWAMMIGALGAGLYRSRKTRERSAS